MFKNDEKVKEIRKEYPVGTKVKLLRMDDAQAPPIGTTGVVNHVDDIGSIHVSWDSGGSLALIVDIDEFVKL